MMRGSLTYIKFVGIFLILLVSCNEDRINENDFGSITGKVVAEGTNEPLANVRISTSPVTSTVFSNVDGNFIIENVRAGEYSVTARLDGYLAGIEPATVITNASVNVIFEMEVSTANNRPPSTPVLKKPAENEVLQSTEAIFEWSSTDPEKDPITFSIELRNDKNEEVLKFEDITDSTYVYSELMLGAQYFWQVSESFHSLINAGRSRTCA